MDHYGYVTGYLKKDHPYTIVYTRSVVGIFYYNDFKEYLKWYISKSAQLQAITVAGMFPQRWYIAIVPVVDNLDSPYLVKIINEAVEKFRAKYTPQALMSTLAFSDIHVGPVTTAMKEEEKKKGLPEWGRDLAIIGAITLIAGIAVAALIKKI